MIGKTISQYKILEKLGEGGMGVVFKAQDTRLDREVALKFLPRQIAASDEERVRFKIEARAAAALNHANIATIYNIEEVDDKTFIVMEYVDGQTLADRIKEGPLPLKDALKLATQIAEGLQAAHEKEIFHRDIKPANILITEKGQVRITDFGLAKLAGRTRLTKEEASMGTVAYMSPEQTQGAKVDHRTDIWALGAVIYEMLTGKQPFAGDYEQAVMYSILHEDPVPPTAQRTGVPMELERIVLKALAKEPGERYQHVDEMQVDLTLFKNELESGVRPSREVIHPTAEKKAFESLMNPGILVAFAILIVAGYFFFDRILRTGEPGPEIHSADKPKNSIAILHFENNTGDEGLEYWRKALSDLIIADLSQSRFIKVLSGSELFYILKELEQLESTRYSSDVLNEVASRGKVRHILVGNYARAGVNFRINVMLQDVSTSELIGSYSVEGIGEENVFSMVDELTQKIKTYFNLSEKEIAGDIDLEVGRITSGSPEAFRYYSEGKQLQLEGNYLQSIPLFERALAIDPEFAMAYRAMALSYSKIYIGYRTKMESYLGKALELTDRISARERYLIRGDYYRLSEKTWDKAIAAYEDLLEFYPDDLNANRSLGNLYLNLEEWDRAIKRFEVNIKYNDEDISLYRNTASAYRAQGLFDKAREVLEYYLDHISDNAGIHRSLANNFILQRKFDLAHIELDKAFSFDSTNFNDFNNTFTLRGDIYHYQGDLAKAAREYEYGLKMADVQARGSFTWRLAYLSLTQGKFEKFKHHVNQAIQFSKEQGELSWQGRHVLYMGVIDLKLGNFNEALKKIEEAQNIVLATEDSRLLNLALFRKGCIYLKMNLIDEAQKVADELKESIAKGLRKKHMRCYYYLTGMMAQHQDSVRKSIEYFQKAVALQTINLVSYPDFVYQFALAYYKAGELERAAEELQKIVNHTGFPRLSFGHIYAESLYWLGKIYQEMGWEGKAIEHFARFIELWKDCDAVFRPLVTDAEAQLTELKNIAGRLPKTNDLKSESSGS